MPVVADYTMILGDLDKDDGAGSTFREWDNWDTGGRTDGTAYISLMTFGLDSRAKKLPRVLVNGTFVGRLVASSDSGWMTQAVHFEGKLLKSGKNKLEIKDAPLDAQFKSIVCHFHQET